MLKNHTGGELHNKNDRTSSFCSLEKDPVFTTEKGKVSSNVSKGNSFEKFQKGTKFPKQG